MNKAYLLTGGNLGNREDNLRLALISIETHCGVVLKASSIYETAAWGKTDQAPFLNQALAIETQMDPLKLLNTLLDVEKLGGRVRKEKYGPRTLDIDILLYDDFVINESSLVVPHPELQNRRFALEPLAEIAPQLVHPVFHKPIKQLLQECTDNSLVTKWTNHHMKK